MTLLARLVLVVWIAAALPAGAEYRRGPELLAQPPAGTPTAFLAWGQGGAESWPPEFVAAVRSALGGAGGAALVGQTDALGPRALNDALGLQYAVSAAQRLAAHLGVPLWRFACASRGEASSGGPGVSVFAWAPGQPDAAAPSAVAILDPTPSLPRGDRLWAVWKGGGGPALWVREGPLGGATWELPAAKGIVRIPLPGRDGSAGVGVAYPGGRTGAAAVEVAPPRDDEALELRLEAVEAWAVRLRARLPLGYGEPRVWCAGIPYPVSPGPGGEIDLWVALLPAGNRAYLQAVDTKGRVAVGPVAVLPDGQGPAPTLLAVAAWEGRRVDLDLHAWRGERHTHPQEPDPALSQKAAPGTRLLFEGNFESRATALAAWGEEELELELWCYTDLGGDGAEAWVYVIERPGDLLEGRARLLGPRRLTEGPLHVRWPLLARR